MHELWNSQEELHHHSPPATNFQIWLMVGLACLANTLFVLAIVFLQ
jgi:hypothetical protein